MAGPAIIKRLVSVMLLNMARPSMDAYGIDISKTVEPLGLKVEFNKSGELLPCWYSMVLED